MPVHFIVDTLAENDGVSGLPSTRGVAKFSSIEAQLHAIKEVKSAPVEDRSGGPLAIRAEEDAHRKDALEALDNTTIVGAVFG